MLFDAWTIAPCLCIQKNSSRLHCKMKNYYQNGVSRYKKKHWVWRSVVVHEEHTEIHLYMTSAPRHGNIWFYNALIYNTFNCLKESTYHATKWESIHQVTTVPSVSWWRHQTEIFSALLGPFVRGNHRSPVNAQHKGQWRGALIFSLICVWINDWVHNREGGRWFETPSRPLWYCNDAMRPAELGIMWNYRSVMTSRYG